MNKAGMELFRSSLLISQSIALTSEVRNRVAYSAEMAKKGKKEKSPLEAAPSFSLLHKIREPARIIKIPTPNQTAVIPEKSEGIM